MTKRREKEILEAMIGVGAIDIDHPEYGTTALTILAEIAVRTGASDRLIADDSPSPAVAMFLETWRSMRNGGNMRCKTDLSPEIRIILSDLNSITINRRNTSTVCYRINRDTGRLVRLQGRRPPEDETVRARVQSVVDLIRHRVEKSLAGLVETNGVKYVSDVGAYHPYRIAAEMRTGYRFEASIQVAAMRNDSDADLLRAIDHDIDKLIAQQLNFRYDDPAVQLQQQWIDAEVRKSDLPVTIRIVPGKTSHEGIPVILTGYGINGMKSRTEIARMYRNNSEVEQLNGKVIMALMQQGQRHKDHGPEPRDMLDDDWRIDAILDRHVARIPGGHDTLRRMIEQGRLRDDGLPGIVLRVVGKAIYGTMRLGPKVISHGDRVRFDDAVLAMTVQNALRGEPLSRLAEHPDFPEDMLISRCRTYYSKHRDYTVAHARKYLVPLVA